jgi:hypothetical protein
VANALSEEYLELFGPPPPKPKKREPRYRELVYKATLYLLARQFRLDEDIVREYHICWEERLRAPLGTVQGTFESFIYVVVSVQGAESNEEVVSFTSNKSIDCK